MPHRVGELFAFDIERRAALARNDGGRERQRRMADVGAADVEGPGHRVRIGDDQRVGAQICDLGLDARELGVGLLAGEAQVVQRHRRPRRRGPVLPDRVDRVGLGRHQRGAGVGAGARQPFRAVGGVQPGVVAELGAGRQVCFQPLLGRRLGEGDDGEDGGVDLSRGLQRVAAIDEQGGAVGRAPRTARRSR